MFTRRQFHQLGAAGVAGLMLPRRRVHAAQPSVDAAGNHFSRAPGPASGVALAGVPRGSDAAAVARAVRRAAESVTDFAWLSRGDTVLIKPVCNSGNAYPATTDPVALHAMVRLLKEKGAGRVVVGDMSGVQFVRFQKDSLRGSSRALMVECGVARAAEEAGAELVAFEEAGWDGFVPETPLDGPDWKRPILMPQIAADADHIVLMPRCARHVLAGSTLGLKAAVGWWRTDSRYEYHHDAASFSRKTAEANTIPLLLDKQRLVLTSATEVLSTFGPDQGYIAKPETGLVIASRSVVSHDMVSLAWLLDSQQLATPRADREGVLNDPNQSETIVNLMNRVVTVWLGGGIRGAISAETLERYDLDSVWSDRVLQAAFRIKGGVPELDLAAIDRSVPDALRARLQGAIMPPLA